MYTPYICVKRVSPTLDTPTPLFPGSAGHVLQASITSPVEIAPNGVVDVPTGFIWQLPEYCVGHIDGVPANNKQGLVTLPESIENNYREELRVTITNVTDQPLTLTPGQAVGQLLVVQCVAFDVKETVHIDDTTRHLPEVLN